MSTTEAYALQTSNPIGKEMVMAALEHGLLTFHAKLSAGVGPETVTPDVARGLLMDNIERLDSKQHDIDICAIFNQINAEILSSRTSI
jgi:hypothetical protein